MSDSTASPCPLTGGCLCGRVRYEATPDHRDGYYCHCRMCQLAFGNTRAAFINLRKAEVRWLECRRRTTRPSKIARRGFCSHCGTPLAFEYLDSERMDLASRAASTIRRSLKPTAHFAIESRIAALARRGRPARRAAGRQRAHQHCAGARPTAMTRGAGLRDRSLQLTRVPLRHSTLSLAGNDGSGRSARGRRQWIGSSVV